MRKLLKDLENILGLV